MKAKLIIFFTATFLFIGCVAAEDTAATPTFAVDDCDYLLPGVGAAEAIYDGTTNPDYRNFQWSRSSDGRVYLGIQIVRSENHREVKYIILSSSSVSHGDLLRSVRSRGFDQPEITLYSVVALLPLDLDENRTGEELMAGQVFQQTSSSLEPLLYVSDHDLAAYTYGASNYFNGLSMDYDFGTDGYRDGLFLGVANFLNLREDAYYTHYSTSVTSTSPEGAAIVKKQESTYFLVPCDAAEFDFVMNNANSIESYLDIAGSLEAYFPNYKTTYPAPPP